MTEEEMYDAVVNNDGNYDGLFFYGVNSTGIFCRPSCPSKKPLRENVRFFQTAAEAKTAGFRPCKRCRSDLLSYHPMEEIAGLVKERLDALYEEQSAWNEGVQGLGLSRRRAVEVFKAAYGMTPKAYMDELKLNEAKRLLTETDRHVVDIAAGVGFGGLSTFNRFFQQRVGCTPREYRRQVRESDRNSEGSNPKSK